MRKGSSLLQGAEVQATMCVPRQEALSWPDIPLDPAPSPGRVSAGWADPEVLASWVPSPLVLPPGCPGTSPPAQLSVVSTEGPGQAARGPDGPELTLRWE